MSKLKADVFAVGTGTPGNVFAFGLFVPGIGLVGFFTVVLFKFFSRDIGGEYTFVNQTFGGGIAIAALIFSAACFSPVYRRLYRALPTSTRSFAIGVVTAATISLAFAIVYAIQILNARLDLKVETVVFPAVSELYVSGGRGYGYWLINVREKSKAGLATFVWAGRDDPGVQRGQCLHAQRGPGWLGLSWNGSEHLASCRPEVS